MALVKVLFFDRVGQIISKREGFITENIASSKAIQASIEEKITSKNPQAILMKAREEALHDLNDASEKATHTRAKLVEETKAELRKSLDENLAKLQNDKEELLKQSNVAIKELAAFAITKMLGDLSVKEVASV